MEAIILQHLINLAGGRLVLKPAHLSKVTGWTASVQSRLRRDNKMPIPFKATGKAITYSVPDVAKYLLNPTPIHYEEKSKVEDKAEINIKRKQKLRTYDFSREMILNAFATHIEEQRLLMEDLSQAIKSHSLRLNLADEIKDKNTAFQERETKI